MPMRVAIAAALVVLMGCDDEHDDAPAINSDQLRDHADRGPCTGCHQVSLGPLGRTARAAPVISSDSVRPHPDRGVCETCHMVTGGASR